MESDDGKIEYLPVIYTLIDALSFVDNAFLFYEFIVNIDVAEESLPLNTVLTLSIFF